MTGERHGKLTVLSLSGFNSEKTAVWQCRCDCGNIVDRARTGLKDGSTTSCGCDRKAKAQYAWDLTGTRHERLVVVGLDGHSQGGKQRWPCKCDCGREVIRSQGSLLSGDTTSCGCLKGERIAQFNQNARKGGVGPRVKDMLGKRFGRLVVVSYAQVNRYGDAMWRCKCDCGNTGLFNGQHLRRGSTASCGCYRTELAANRTRLPKGTAAFNATLQRCKSAAAKRNLPFELSAEEFAGLVKSCCHYCGAQPSMGFTGYEFNGIDRVDNSLGYVEGNVVPCCGRCNRAKWTNSSDQFKAWAANLYHTFVENADVMSATATAD